MNFSSAVRAPSPVEETRKRAMAILAESKTGQLVELLGLIGTLPNYEEIRRPENGLVMVRGRIGGDGAPFNLGEATVTRSAVRLATGEIGFSYVLGRDHEKSRLMALCDALIQSDRYRGAIEHHVFGDLLEKRVAERKLKAERTAATKVEFFTLVRGEDER
jgi:alpha-D-ribose 1-methylphosphonate 5-triphosphate synthase subunit PhnG